MKILINIQAKWAMVLSLVNFVISVDLSKNSISIVQLVFREKRIHLKHLVDVLFDIHSLLHLNDEYNLLKNDFHF